MFYPSSNCDKMYLLPLEGVRGVELVTYSDVINIGLPFGKDGLGQFPTTSIAPSYDALYLVSLSPLSPFTMKPLLLRSYSLSH